MSEELPTAAALDDLLDRLLGTVGEIADGAQRSALAVLCHHLGEAIQQRDAAERELRTRADRYRTLFRNAAEAMFRSDLTGRIIEANPATARMLGCPNIETVLRLNLMHDIYASHHQRDVILRELQSSGTLHARECLARRQDGSTFWISLSANVVTDEKGAPCYIDAIGEDITGRRAAQDQLRESERRYRLLVETSHDLIWSISAAGVFIFVNHAVEGMVGLQPEQVLGLHFGTFLTERGRAIAEQAFTELREGAANRTFEVEAQHVDGSLITVEVKAASQRDDRGTFLGASGTTHDLTQQRLLQAQLAQAQKMQAIGQLAGGMAHDFNNQLAGIGGFSELLLQELENGSIAHQYAERIHALARRGSALTRKLLTFARQDSDPSQPVDVHQVVEEVLPLLELGGRSNITIERHLDAPRSIVMGDRSLLGNAVLNLLVNARDAMPEGGRIIVTTRITHPDAAANRSGTFELRHGSEHLKLQVCDTGLGMEDWVRERIFEPFFTTKAPGLGTGIGLSTVFGTIRGHRGAIAVESGPGAGTVFTILLPLADRAQGQQRESSGARPILGQGEGEGEVLVAEDEEVLRSMLEQALLRSGYQPTTCRDGQEAVERFAAEPGRWRLVILDLTMPRLDGEETLQRLRELSTDLPVLVISGNIPNSVAHRLTADPAVGVLRKPFALRELIDAIGARIRAR